MRSMKPDELVYNSARERKRVRGGGALSISLSLMIIKAWRDEISLMEDNIPASVSCYYSIFRVKGSARLKPKISLAYYHPLPCYYVAGRQATAEARIIDKGDTMMERRTRKKRKKEDTGEREERANGAVRRIWRKEKSKCSVRFTDGGKRRAHYRFL